MKVEPRIGSFLPYIDRFRGAAIIVVVLWHSYVETPRPGNDSLPGVAELVFANLLAGGTFYFVFIAGFLFHHVFMRKFEYGRFLAGKARNVLMPYLFMSVLPLIYSVALRPDLYERWGIDDPILAMGFFLVTGRHLLAYWFIPFILLMFLLSPVFIGFARLRHKLPLIVALFMLSALVQRPEHELNPLHSVIYYLPAYLLGMFVSIERDKVFAALRGKELPLLVLSLGLAFAQAAFTDVIGNFEKASILSWNGVDLSLATKIASCLFLLAALKRTEHAGPPVLEHFAKFSFGIFFLHPYLLSVFRRVVPAVHDGETVLIGFVLIALPVLVGSLLVARVVVDLRPGDSRRLIGC